MSPPSNLPAGFLETTVAHLAKLFLPGTDGDPTAARHAAAHTLQSYGPQTEDELSLAATIISSSLQALEALGQAAMPDQSLTRILRLRGGAVSLSREADKARRLLGQLQKDRQQSVRAQTEPESVHPETVQPETAQLEPKLAPARDVTTDQSQTTIAARSVKPPPRPTHEQLQEDARIAASLKRAEARIAALSGSATPAILPGPHGSAIAQIA